MKKIVVNFIEGNYGRIKTISNYCEVSFDKVLNVSLVSGFEGLRKSRYLIKKVIDVYD